MEKEETEFASNDYQTQAYESIRLRYRMIGIKWVPNSKAAETHYAGEVCADRILNDLRARNESQEGIFLIEHVDLERADYVVQEEPETPDQVLHMSALTRVKVLQQLILHTET